MPCPPASWAFSVVLLDVAVGLVEQLLVGVQLVFEQRSTQFLLHQSLALGRVLPVGEADLLHDVVDVGDDALDDDVRIAVPGFREEFGERLFGSVLLNYESPAPPAAPPAPRTLWRWCRSAALHWV